MISLYIKSSIIAATMLLSGNFINQSNKISCCAPPGGKCTGSANCTACSNCSRCGYCNSGGSCGVCSGNRRKTTNTRSSNTYSTPAYSNPVNYDSGYNTNTPKKITELKLIVTTQELKLRSGPGTENESIENLTLGDQVNYISKDGVWINVMSESQNIGYVYYKYVKFVE